MIEIGLCDERFAKESCGVGFIANVNGYSSHQIIIDGITVLKNLRHRSAFGTDPNTTSDGVGILVQIPHNFFLKESTRTNIPVPAEGTYGVGMFFFPQEELKRNNIIQNIETIVEQEGWTILGWRSVPVDDSCLHEPAPGSVPFIMQLFVTSPHENQPELERKLYILRKCIEHLFAEKRLCVNDAYVASFSCRTIVYKGMLTAFQLETYYKDLTDPDFQSTLVVLHQRYSTNTFSSWPLAQPFRCIAHNGAINSIRGNFNKMRARESRLVSPLFGEEIRKLLPIINSDLSDSGMFDAVFELLTMAGRSMEHAMMMMIPEAFGPKYHISQDKRSFYQFHTAIMEPWDGPAAMVFTDGNRVGVTLDRNGLRPSRYTITRSGVMICASETGVLDIPPTEILRKGRLGPGRMIIVDTEKKKIFSNNEIKSAVSRRQPYRRWLEKNSIELKGLFQVSEPVTEPAEPPLKMQKVFGYTREDIEMILLPMALYGQESVGSMAVDAALAVMSSKPQLLYDYFRQLFAQVIHPPLDPYRENMVMSLMSFIGTEGNLLEETPQHCHQLKLPHPLLTNEDMKKLRGIPFPDFQSCTIPALFDKEGTGTALQTALDILCQKAVDQIDKGFSLLILSDRAVSQDKIPIPSLLALSAVHHHLIVHGMRHRAGIIMETGEAREIMHIATLIGFGASAVNPYLALETIANLKRTNHLPQTMKTEIAIDNYITAIKKGLLKTMSKMGISTIRSFRGAQVFEAIGLADNLMQRFFQGTPSRIGGIGIDQIAAEAQMRHYAAYKNNDNSITELDPGGTYQQCIGGERHQITPEAITLLQKAVKENDYSIYKKYSETVDGSTGNYCTLRDLWSFVERKPVPLNEVEPIESILRRFCTAAMSLGSISPEAYETIAIAMNHLGLKCNCGEGGDYLLEDSNTTENRSKSYAVKQVASARFGVTSTYLAQANEIQIKINQGAKPGEGGQLPGYKVNEIIARLRYTIPGVTQISPPPHHDLYSIEDLAQLICDLKNANPSARISVKLVAEAGIGAVATGVAKTQADMIVISGCDGSTGASPLTSLKYAGIPWEIGLAEANQMLNLNRIRQQIKLQVDGKLKNGRDVIIGALLGADEFAFGTIPLIALGCTMARSCHLNNCLTGIATQNEELRRGFAGKPEYIVNLMTFIAMEVREFLSKLGFTRMEELIGRCDLLMKNPAIDHWKAKHCDFSRIFLQPESIARSLQRNIPFKKTDYTSELDVEILKIAETVMINKESIRLFSSIRNHHRSVGARLSGEISKRYGPSGLPSADTISCKFTGSAGQSFGAFLCPGIKFELEGEANDFVGKGLCGGLIILVPPRRCRFNHHNNTISGNANLFGATSGELYICGKAGERFAVRNCGAHTVVEGVGDNCCEYMTGGVVVILGRTGINFAAGMSGGVAYILDDNQLFDTRCNLETVNIEPVSDHDDQNQLKNLIHNHVRYTSSDFGRLILEHWSDMLPKFVKVLPIAYKGALERFREEEQQESEIVPVIDEVY